MSKCDICNDRGGNDLIEWGPCNSDYRYGCKGCGKREETKEKCPAYKEGYQAALDNIERKKEIAKLEDQIDKMSVQLSKLKK